jgi:catechol 2,3-dioxygenase-like lactoylglutathione lyase family enzyme
MAEFDSVRIGVVDLAAGRAQYEALLGVPPILVAGESVRFQLARGAVELALGTVGLSALCFAAKEHEGAAAWPSGAEAFNGIEVSVRAQSVGAIPPVPPSDAMSAIDHVVIQTPDIERVRHLWRDQLGVRLALDKPFPARGLHMLFFRSVGVTLEFVGSLPPAPAPRGPDHLYGIAYRVEDLAACRDRLVRAGLDVSDMRDGQLRGTIVATVRSGTAGVPTLVIQEEKQGIGDSG